MDPLDIFRDSFEDRHKAIEAQLETVIADARQFMPYNFQELLHDHEDGEFDYPLEWVKVADPNSNKTTPAIEVLPLIGLWQGDEEIDPGVSHLTLVGKLPNGKEREIGTLRHFEGRYDPELILNYPGKFNHCYAIVEWESADAEIFLNLAESVLQAQNPQS